MTNKQARIEALTAIETIATIREARIDVPANLLLAEQILHDFCRQIETKQAHPVQRLEQEIADTKKAAIDFACDGMADEAAIAEAQLEKLRKELATAMAADQPAAEQTKTELDIYDASGSARRDRAGQAGPGLHYGRRPHALLRDPSYNGTLVGIVRRNYGWGRIGTGAARRTSRVGGSNAQDSSMFRDRRQPRATSRSTAMAQTSTKSRLGRWLSPARWACSTRRLPAAAGSSAAADHQKEGAPP